MFKIAKAEFEQVVEFSICRLKLLHHYIWYLKRIQLFRDCRQLNIIITPDSYPLPDIHDSNLHSHGYKIFSKINLVRVYHQIPVAEEDIYETAITTPFGLYEFLGMPFGVRNAAQTFQRFINEVISGLDFVYVDDILVASSDETSLHISNI